MPKDIAPGVNRQTPEYRETAQEIIRGHKNVRKLIEMALPDDKKYLINLLKNIEEWVLKREGESAEMTERLAKVLSERQKR